MPSSKWVSHRGASTTISCQCKWWSHCISFIGPAHCSLTRVWYSDFSEFFLLEGLTGVAAHSRYATSIEWWLALRRNVHPQYVGDLSSDTFCRAGSVCRWSSEVLALKMSWCRINLVLACVVCTYPSVFSCTCPSYIHLTDTPMRSMSRGWFGILLQEVNFWSTIFFNHYFTIGAYGHCTH